MRALTVYYSILSTEANSLYWLRSILNFIIYWTRRYILNTFCVSCNCFDAGINELAYGDRQLTLPDVIVISPLDAKWGSTRKSLLTVVCWRRPAFLRISLRRRFACKFRSKAIAWAVQIVRAFNSLFRYVMKSVNGLDVVEKYCYLFRVNFVNFLT